MPRQTRRIGTLKRGRTMILAVGVSGGRDVMDEKRIVMLGPFRRSNIHTCLHFASEPQQNVWFFVFFPFFFFFFFVRGG